VTARIDRPIVTGTVGGVRTAAPILDRDIRRWRCAAGSGTNPAMEGPDAESDEKRRYSIG
jgi:hypothetical protein